MTVTCVKLTENLASSRCILGKVFHTTTTGARNVANYRANCLKMVHLFLNGLGCFLLKKDCQVFFRAVESISGTGIKAVCSSWCAGARLAPWLFSELPRLSTRLSSASPLTISICYLSVTVAKT